MDSSRAVLQEGVAELGIEATEQQIDLLLAFVKLIAKWNKAYNLSAIRKQEDMLHLHILDSLAVLPYVVGEKIIDVGTGAGLPGIPLAIFMPSVQFTLLDSNSKKTRFVQQSIMELDLKNVEIVHGRVEELGRVAEYDVVISRAFTSLHDMMGLTEYLLQPQGMLLAMKGQVPKLELEKIGKTYSVESIAVPGVDAERCLVRVNKT
ncbi:MAG: 16S rRNA (guanine527-N7)-methyltransferase [Methyloprofundus sp.]|nr:MAG: 16S rRNA (guanine527-N7)-methyltransferase [Methyloprofundus sp.]